MTNLNSLKSAIGARIGKFVVNNLPKNLTLPILSDSLKGMLRIFAYQSIPEGAADGVHENVIRLLRNRKRGKLLDIASGSGNISFNLKILGYDVVAADIDTSKFLPEDINCCELDANTDLPFDSESFDYVVSVETIEHLENPWKFINEVHRVLKRNGTFILTTPNVETIQSRLYFLICGRLRGFQEDGFITSRHITPIFSWSLEHMIKDKFKIGKATFNDGETIALLYKFRKTRIRPIRIKNKLFGEIHIISMKKI